MRIDYAYEVQPEEDGFRVQLSASLNGQPLFRSGAYFVSLLEVIGDACFHAYANIQSLKSAIEESHAPDRTVSVL